MPTKSATFLGSAHFGETGLDSQAASQLSRVSASSGDGGYKGVRRLIWLYFVLLIFEGALRKWVFPGQANVLLLIRAPVVILCYLVAWRAGKFPKDAFVVAVALLGLASLVASFLVTPVNGLGKILLVTLFGVHANFLHLPLIFLIRDAFDRERLLPFGKWLMILAPLMAMIVFLQYRAAPDAWVNRGAGIGSGQITAGVSGVDKIRPAGLFSYNTGLGSYLALLAAFLLHHLLGTKGYPRTILIPATVSLIVATCLAISRTTAFSITTVYVASLLCVLFNARLFTRSILVTGLVGVAALLVAKFSILGEGLSILQWRVTEAGGMKRGGGDRLLDGFSEPFRVAAQAGQFGFGLGLGTNAGGQVMTGERAFYLGAETEWARNVMEGGVVLGFAYILLRVALSLYLLRAAIGALSRRESLPLLLLSTCFINVLMGQFGVPMTLGFAVFSAGLCLAATRDPQQPTEETPPQSEKPSSIKSVRGRSAYAEQLHGGPSAT